MLPTPIGRPGPAIGERRSADMGGSGLHHKYEVEGDLAVFRAMGCRTATQTGFEVSPDGAAVWLTLEPSPSGGDDRAAEVGNIDEHH